MKPAAAPPPSLPPAVLVLSARGLTTARRVLPSLPPGASLHALRGRAAPADSYFDRFGDRARDLFEAGHPLLVVCAAGAIIRALAPSLRDKGREPPVVCLAEDGSAVLPLLGAHRGGNDLARRAAAALGVTPALSTASELHFGIALDAPPMGYSAANPHCAKAFAAALLAGARVRLVGKGKAPWLAASDLPWEEGDEGTGGGGGTRNGETPDGNGPEEDRPDRGRVPSPLRIEVTEAPRRGSSRHLVYHPRRLALGVGCERGAEPRQLIELCHRALAGAELAPGAVAGLYSLDLKEDEAALHAAAASLGLPLRFFSAAELERERTRLRNPSEVVYRAVGCHGVAEAAALAAAGAEAALLVPKRVADRATCAVARAPEPFDGAARGRPRGHLAVVGLGPGSSQWRSPEAASLLARADDILGYRLYLELLDPAPPAARLHPYAIGEEERRVRDALALAATGRRAALVCSGDPGIFALASLVFEVLEGAEVAAWGRLEVAVAPGISALQGAAARVGAPLGHDFCAISLSDLLTPREVIERRLRAAAAGDFAVALYNPQASRRRVLLGIAADILATRRPAATPVVLARDVGRPGERVEVIRLDELAGAEVDMRTLVLVGASGTRRFSVGAGDWVYTPRGYADRGAALAP